MNFQIRRSRFQSNPIVCILFLLLAGLDAQILFGLASAPEVHPGNRNRDDEPLELILALDEATNSSERQQILIRLKKLGAKTLIALKQPPKGLSSQTRNSLRRIKFEIEQAINQNALKPSRFSLSGSFTLSEALRKIEAQTGILIESRIDSEVTREISLDKVEFWRGIDRILDQFDADVFQFSDPTNLQITKSNRSGSRSDLTSYSGIARVEATNLFSMTDLTGRGKPFNRAWLDVRWEPRLKPFELIVDHESIKIIDGSGKSRKAFATSPIVRPISQGDSFKQLEIQFESIPRSVDAIRNLQGKLVLKTPVGRQQFRFSDVARTKNASKRIGETTVKVTSVDHNGSSLSIAMQFELDNPGDSLDSHKGWMFQNKAYLVDKKLNRILVDKIMTTTQEKNKMGFVFTFAKIDGPEGFDFVYETPTSIREIPLNWQIDNIKLD